MDAAATNDLHALAPPPRLHSRKRRASCDLISSSTSSPSTSQRAPPYFSAAAFARFSVLGERSMGEQHGAAELRVMQHAPPKPTSTPAGGSQPRKHLLTLVAEQHARRVSTSTRSPPVPSTEDAKGVDARVLNATRRVSALPLAQHAQYMELLQKRILAQQNAVPAILALTPAESERWQALDARVQQEQADLRHDLEAIARSSGQLAAPPMSTAVESWYERTLQQCRNDVFQMYARHYEASVRVETQGDLASRELCTMKHVQEVFSYGRCPAVSDERFVGGMAIDLAPAAEADAFVVRSPISADAHAEKLMAKFDCDVAISSSTLVTLFDVETHRLADSKSPEWLVPVKVRVVVSKSGAAKKQAYFDPPLPAEAVGVREKLAAAGRASVLAALQAAPNGEAQTPPREGAQGRTAYHVWELGGRRVLVRFTTHAHLVPTDDPNSEVEDKASQAKLHPLSVFVKPDCRFLSINEQITASEKRRFWLHAWLRGGSVLLIGHLNPRSLTVESWEKHSLASLVYGRDASHAPEWFEPMENFQVVNEVFAVITSFAIGNYLVRSSHRHPAMTAGKGKGGGGSSHLNDIVVLTAATGMDNLSVVGSTTTGSDTLDLFQFITRPRESADALAFVLPKWTYVPGRIPYTFRTPTYCRPFFASGVCPKIERREYCDALHLRLMEHEHSDPAWRFWRFEDHSKRLKVLAKIDPLAVSSVKLPLPVRVQHTFQFCTDARVADPSNVWSLLQCPKPKGECALAHPTLHEVLEHVADEVVRRAREHRKSGKAASRQKRPSRHADAGKP